MLLACLLYLHPKSDRSVNVFLALYICCFSITAATPHIEKLVTWQKSFFMEPFPLLAGPLLFLYIRSFSTTITWRKALPHFIPFIALMFISYAFFSYMSHKFPDAKEVPAEALHDPWAISLGLLRLSQLLIYFFVARRALIKYQHSIRHILSDTSKLDLHWIRWLVNGYLILVLSAIVMYALMLQYPQHFFMLLLIHEAILTPYIYVATYKGITQPTLWKKQPGLNKAIIENELQKAEELEQQVNHPEKPKPKTGLSQDRIDELTSKIIVLMEVDKLYQETDLTLQHLADKLQSPTHQVSQTINEGMKKNFYDLVNGYRVAEAKRLLLEPGNRNYTILSVGFEAGFNSKTTFNTVFKKFTGLTPTEFRERELMSLPQA
jgi:AraC-like DNA-binding protein